MGGQVDLLGDRILRQMHNGLVQQNCHYVLSVLCSAGTMSRAEIKLCYMFSTADVNLGQFHETCNIQAVICNIR